MTTIVWENSFFAISALSTLLGGRWFHVEPRKTTFLEFFNPWTFFISIVGLNFHFLQTSFFWNF